LPRFCGEFAATLGKGRLMFSLLFLRGALQALALMFGSLGGFCLIQSCRQPSFVGCAVFFLAVASAIIWNSPQN
jgi:hypothetical protein